MKVVAIQLNSGAHWEHNRQQIAEQLAALPQSRPCLVLLPENFACLGATADYQAVAEPMQKELKMRPSRSSELKAPVISLSCSWASRSSSATSSPAA